MTSDSKCSYIASTRRQPADLSHGLVMCYRSRIRMRRLVTSFVLAVMAWSFVAPMALAFTGSDVPACCRRNGKHHCQMSGMSGMAAMSAGGVPSFRSRPSDCPYRAQKATPTGTAAPQTETISALELPCTTFLSAVDFHFHYSRPISGNSQRGPPAFSL